jgi:hypothetical protein
LPTCSEIAKLPATATATNATAAVAANQDRRDSGKLPRMEHLTAFEVTAFEATAF